MVLSKRAVKPLIQEMLILHVTADGKKFLMGKKLAAWRIEMGQMNSLMMFSSISWRPLVFRSASPFFNM